MYIHMHIYTSRSTSTSMYLPIYLSISIYLRNQRRFWHETVNACTCFIRSLRREPLRPLGGGLLARTYPFHSNFCRYYQAALIKTN